MLPEKMESGSAGDCIWKLKRDGPDARWNQIEEDYEFVNCECIVPISLM